MDIAASPRTNGATIASRCDDVSPVQSASTKRIASASLAATPADIAFALDPAETPSVTTLAPAWRARSPVPSLDPSSTTITSRTNEQPRAAATFAATVGASFRAGMTTSIVVMPGRSAAGTGETGALAAHDDLLGDLARRLV